MTSRGDSREKILHTASRLFQLQGYHATGLNQIVKESGAPKGSLYHFFPNGKEELAIEAVTYTGKIVEHLIQQSMDESSDPIEAIQLFIKKTASQFDNTESIKGIPVGLLASETALISEPLRTVCMKVFKSWEAVFARKLMENGFAEEEANQLGTLINSMIEGGIMLSLTNKDKTPLLLIAEQIPVLVRKKG
ncbi:putative HTH-type transcriptional regulator YxaF [Bacillus subtilis]|uniref:TetR/AcrR family transcriptional regulator n=1 Tax=Bacillus subtilis TaxID=1423 RepID=UPI001B999616|nr:TetR/AcrR family transcriptional regulator [Bacillus subtilis]UBZ20895.1 putative HTH-type transcriptional regulator YxaF [Bacillus subtilis]UPG81558.1 transcriptional regulator YxaF [Bacillus subtilis]WAE48366.1 transcriptional regulator YxaF [Bacillus subtilis]CAF1818646.1 putative HTH-type transcriptional regulator YxaF [Bacillus subtilis]CAI6321588.1 transcriptional regulator YxaF [Bacillus subtilis]